MKWWHRWRWRTWQVRYFMARGRVQEIRERTYEDTPEYDAAFEELQQARSACEYHWEKLK